MAAGRVATGRAELNLCGCSSRAASCQSTSTSPLKPFKPSRPRSRGQPAEVNGRARLTSPNTLAGGSCKAEGFLP